MFQKTKLAACTAVLCCTLLAPAFAQSQSNDSSAKAAAQRIVDQSVDAIQALKSNGDFQSLAKKAKGIFLVPTLAKGAVVVGGSGGTGVLLVRDRNGGWSDPAFLTIGSISIGAQAGGKAGPVAILLMTDKAVADFTQNNNFSINGNAGLTVVNWSPTAQGSVGKGDVVIWSGQSGLFAGLNISGSDVVADTAADHAFYGSEQADTQSITSDQVKNDAADKLKSALPS